MGQSAIAFYSKKIELEGVVSFPADAGAKSAPGVAVCHPHPALGGSMSDPVVMSVCRAADAQGMVTLRFNFRGVGGSQGEFSNGQREHEDVKSALDVLRHWPTVNRGRMGLVGYSVGATIILDGYRHMRRAAAVALIAPTLAALRSRRFGKDKRPRLVIAGSADRVAPSLDIQRVLDGCRGPVQFHEIQGADHSMRGHQGEVGEVTADFLIRNL